MELDELYKKLYLLNDTRDKLNSARYNQKYKIMIEDLDRLEEIVLSAIYEETIKDIKTYVQ